ncbi:hypothetical protein ACRALDRAFT_2018509 [Sodiomyces alcalophilus JCM 7366]|uniref:uncharacterized protein n=1 Tax=Sodiomyces alcalophilus JCM 7366 TaxID=591952 RepID=UPI0039B438B3
MQQHTFGNLQVHAYTLQYHWRLPQNKPKLFIPPPPPPPFSVKAEIIDLPLNNVLPRIMSLAECEYPLPPPWRWLIWGLIWLDTLFYCFHGVGKLSRSNPTAQNNKIRIKVEPGGKRQTRVWTRGPNFPFVTAETSALNLPTLYTKFPHLFSPTMIGERRSIQM